MHKRVVLMGLSILLVAAVVFAATQEFTSLSHRSRTARIQELHPLSDTVVETSGITDEDILNALLTEEQRAAFDKQRQDPADAFSQLATPPVVGDTDA